MMFETLEDKFTKRTEPGPDASWIERLSWKNRRTAAAAAVFLLAGSVINMLGGRPTRRIGIVLVSTSVAINVFGWVRTALRIRKKKEA